MTALLTVLTASPGPAPTTGAPSAGADTESAAPFAAVLDAVAPPAATNLPDTGTGDGSPVSAPGREADGGAATPAAAAPTVRPRTRATAPVDEAARPAETVPPTAPPTVVPMPVTAAIALGILPAPVPAPSPAAPPAVRSGEIEASGPSTAPSLSTRPGPLHAGTPVVRPSSHGAEISSPVACTQMWVQATGSETGTHHATTDAASAASAAIALLPAPQPAAVVAPAPVAAPAPAFVVHEAAQPALASALAHLRRGPDGIHELEVTLHPADLGTVQVKVSMHHGALDVTVSCAHQAAREAVTAALPALHRELAGLHTVDVTSSRPTGDSRPVPGADPRDGRRPDTGEREQPRERRRPEPNPDTFDRWM